MSPRASILASLRESHEPVSGERLADKLRLSRVAVWKHVEALKNAGYDLAAERAGYRLLSERDFLYPWEFPGREARVRHWDKTDSTMDRALQLGLGEHRSNAIVVAESQERGRGREGRSWSSARGGLFFTLLLDPKPRPWRAHRAVMAGGIALCLALRELCGEAFTVEWPNDIYLDGRKAAGLLVEYLADGDRLRLLELGVGVNVSNRRPSAQSLSLSELPAKTPRRSFLLSDFLDRLESFDECAVRPASHKHVSLAAAWNKLSSTRGRLVRGAEDGRRIGYATGIDQEGRLLVERRGGGIVALRPSEACVEKQGVFL